MTQGAGGKEEKSGGNLTDFSPHEKRKNDVGDGSTLWKQQYAALRVQVELVGFSETVLGVRFQ